MNTETMEDRNEKLRILLAKALNEIVELNNECDRYKAMVDKLECRIALAEADIIKLQELNK